LILAFFNISGGELFIIVLVVFLIFGPDKIPEIARWMGKGINEIKRATSDIRDEIDRETGDIRKTTQEIRREISDEFNQVNPNINIDHEKKKPASGAVCAEPDSPLPLPYNLDDDEEKEPKA
jgi:sec-independent protein translocase protein TatA